jgi:hypothetical protein
MQGNCCCFLIFFFHHTKFLQKIPSLTKFVRFWYWRHGSWRNFLLVFCAICSPYTTATLSYNANLGFQVALISSRLWIQLTATLIYMYGADGRNFTYSCHLHQYLRGELLRCMGSCWLLEFCYVNKWIRTISREQSLYFVVQHINHSLDTKRIVLFIAALIEGVPWVLFRCRISS